jgi:hypothetical protein
MIKPILIFILILISSESFSQEIKPGPYKNFISRDFKLADAGSSQQKISAGGIFIVPYFGFVFPQRAFSDNSNVGVNYGAKVEFAHTKIYPFVVGVFFEQAKNKGSEEYKSLHRLNDFQTTITSMGAGVDVILNKYIKSNFTIPFLTLEGKYMNVSRKIDPETNVPDVLTSESLIGYTVGAGFTLYIFDLYSKYTFAKDFSHLSINFRVRYPIVKF